VKRGKVWQTEGMKTPIYVRGVSPAEQHELTKGLRSKEAFTMRRSQILIASLEGKTACQIGKELHCASQTVRNAIKAFNAAGLASLQAGSSRPKTVRPVIDAAREEQLKLILQHSPRQYNKNRSLWTLPLLAEVGSV
jgi:transposase